MSIIGIGVDIVNNNRLKKLFKNKNFIDRIFTFNEQLKSKKLKNKINYFSKRYAAKEAFSKATGFGISKKLHFKDIEVKSDSKGKPSIYSEIMDDGSFREINNSSDIVVKDESDECMYICTSILYICDL